MPTTMPTVPKSVSADLRWLRAGLVALVAAGLGALAHVAAGGLLPSVPEIVMLVAILVGLAAAALGSPAGLGRLAVLVAGGQLLMHLALSATAGHGRPTAHHHDDASPHLVEHVISEVTGANLVMTLAHLAAAAGVATWLLLGEQALWALVALLGARVVVRLLATASLLGRGTDHASSRPVEPRPDRTDRPLRQHLFAAHGPTGRRGPPSTALLVSPTT